MKSPRSMSAFGLRSALDLTVHEYMKEMKISSNFVSLAGEVKICSMVVVSCTPIKKVTLTLCYKN